MAPYASGTTARATAFSERKLCPNQVRVHCARHGSGYESAFLQQAVDPFRLLLSLFCVCASVSFIGSLDSESGIYCLTFDKSGSRLITGEADKTIKIYKEDSDSVCFACLS